STPLPALTGGSSFSVARSLMSNGLAPPSEAREARYFNLGETRAFCVSISPSGVKNAGARLPWLRRTHLPVATSQTAQVWPPGPRVSKDLPSAEKASCTSRLSSVCKSRSLFPLAVSHTQTAPPREAATTLPSAESAA